MATAPAFDLEQPASASTSIAVIVEQNPAIVLVDAGKREDLYAHIKREVEAFEPDLSTEKSRAAIKSLAFKIVRTKTAIDEAGKKLNEEARSRINVIDAARREAREALDGMAKDVRRPLTEWEQAEEARVDHCNQTLTLLKDSALVGYEETAEDVRKRIAKVEEMAFDDDRYLGYAPQLIALKASTLSTLQTVADRMDREETERAELERLRAEAAERERIETEKREAEAAEARRAEAEKAEADRLAKLEQEAAERARREAEAAAETERKRVQAEHDAALAAERAKAEEAERARQAEADRIAKEEAARVAEAERARREQAAREADRAHRGKIMGEAKAALMEIAGIEEVVAKTIVLAIVGGNIPHTRVTF